jgi:hypothetical protein
LCGNLPALPVRSTPETNKLQLQQEGVDKEERGKKREINQEKRVEWGNRCRVSKREK